MSRSNPKMREFAKRLIAYEMKEGSPEAGMPAAFVVCDKLRPQLATLMGNAGYRALLSRALAMTNGEAAWLHAVHVKADGSLEGLDERLAHIGAAEIAGGGVALIAQLLGLLVAFIGEHLTARLLREIWPKLSKNDLGEAK